MIKTSGFGTLVVAFNGAETRYMGHIEIHALRGLVSVLVDEDQETEVQIVSALTNCVARFDTSCASCQSEDPRWTEARRIFRHILRALTTRTQAVDTVGSEETAEDATAEHAPVEDRRRRRKRRRRQGLIPM